MRVYPRAIATGLTPPYPMLPDLPKCDVPGVSWWIHKKGTNQERYRICFRKERHRKTLTLPTTHPARAVAELHRLAEGFNAGRYATAPTSQEHGSAFLCCAD